jgi:hypothetical protein
VYFSEAKEYFEVVDASDADYDEVETDEDK